MTASTPTGRTLTVLVWLTAAGILFQAVTAGQFVSGVAGAVGIHSAVGTALEVAALALVIAAVVDRRTRRHCPSRWWSILLFAIALLVQASLGHAPGAIPTAIHVPVGVTLFAWATVLSIALTRPPPTRPDHHFRPSTHSPTKAGSP